MPNGTQDPDDLGARVAFTIMCFRFGRDPHTNPPVATDRVNVNLSTDLRRSMERQVLTTAATTFLQAQSTPLPFIWQPAGALDLYNVETYKEYHALCWMQLEPSLSMAEEVREALGRVSARSRTRGVERETVAINDAGLSLETRDDVFAALILASGVEGEDFPEHFADLPALEGE